jgi:hypothetical protein
LNCQEKCKFYKFISKLRIIFLMHSSSLRRIWLLFMAFLLFLLAFWQLSLFPRISNSFGMNITEETWVIEMCIWCIKIGIVLVLHLMYYFNTVHNVIIKSFCKKKTNQSNKNQKEWLILFLFWKNDCKSLMDVYIVKHKIPMGKKLFC